MKVDIVRDEEIDPAIPVVISERSSSGPSILASEPRGSRHIRESSITIIVIEHHPAKTSHQKVGPAVIVVVADRRAHGPARISHSRLVGDVGERAVMVI